MSAFLEISQKFIKTIETIMPELLGRIVISGQQWKEIKDGKPYVIISLREAEVMHFTEGEGEQPNEWARNFQLILSVYGREKFNALQVAENLAFIPDKTPFINAFLANNVGVFCNRKIKDLEGIEGATPEFRYDLDFVLKFIGRDKGTLTTFVGGGKIEGIMAEH